MYTFGGAGPVHGAGVARALGAPTVVAPPAAGVLSALGFLTAPLAFDFVRSARAAVLDLSWADVDALFAEMEAGGAALLRESGVDGADVTHTRVAEMRYAGQGYEIRVPVRARAGTWPDALIADFTDGYRSLCRRSGPPVAVEVLNWRVVSSAPAPEVSLRLKESASGDARGGTRLAYFPDLADLSTRRWWTATGCGRVTTSTAPRSCRNASPPWSSRPAHAAWCAPTRAWR